jgi:hypothetical protein
VCQKDSFQFAVAECCQTLLTSILNSMQGLARLLGQVSSAEFKCAH